MDRSLARESARRQCLPSLVQGLLLCGLALVSMGAAAGVYVWYDKDGRPQYSDRPREGAQEVVITPAQTYQAPRPVANTVVASSTARSPAAPAPGCRIVSPIADEVFLNVPSVTVTAIGPPRGTPRLLLNGASIASLDGAPTFTVTPIPRGTYTAIVVFDGGVNTSPLCRTASVTFHVRQPSVIKPAAPKPAPKPKA